jgi:hypothetical protein
MAQTCHSAQETTRLLDALLKKLANDAPAVHHRNEPRHPVHAPATLGVRLGSGQDYKALHRGWALDISRQGLAVLLEHELPVGMEMFVNLEALTGQPCILAVRVIYSRQLLPRAHRIGLAFALDP